MTSENGSCNIGLISIDSYLSRAMYNNLKHLIKIFNRKNSPASLLRRGFISGYGVWKFIIYEMAGVYFGKPNDTNYLQSGGLGDEFTNFLLYDKTSIAQSFLDNHI